MNTTTAPTATIESGAFNVTISGNVAADVFAKSVRASGTQAGGFVIRVAVKATAAVGDANETGIKRIKSALKTLDALGTTYSMDNSYSNRRHSEVQEFRTAYGV